MGYATCRKCNGSGRFYDSKSGKTFDCRACGGSGSNKSLWTTKCKRCFAEIVYKAGASEPQFCGNCRNIQLEKTCAQMGCNNTIRYNVGWSNVPTYCKRCETKRREGWSASTCPGTGVFGCGKLIWSPPGKHFNLCSDCTASKKKAEDENWREKRCAGLRGETCCNTVRYRTDWDKVPDLCPSCKAKAKAQKAQRDAEWKEKPCRICGQAVRYHISWDKPSQICKECKEKGADIFRAELIPSGWHSSIGETQVEKAHGTMVFRGMGTNGADYRVSWNGYGEAHWTDQGLPKGHPNRHRDPRK